MKYLHALALFSLLAVSQGHALEMRLTDGLELVLISNEGGEIGRFPMNTVGAQVTADGQNFMLTFGRDANGWLVAILSPASDKPVDIKVKLSSQQPLLVSAIESGLVGRVSVNQKSIPSGYRWSPDGDAVGPFDLRATDEGTVTVYWRPVGPAAEERRTLDIVGGEGESSAQGITPGVPNGSLSPVPDPTTPTFPGDDTNNPAFLDDGGLDDGDDETEDTTPA